MKVIRILFYTSASIFVCVRLYTCIPNSEDRREKERREEEKNNAKEKEGNELARIRWLVGAANIGHKKKSFWLMCKLVRETEREEKTK